MNVGNLVKIGIPLLVLHGLVVHAYGGEVLPEPGPQNGGLRLRFVAHSSHEDGADRHDMRLDLINVGDEPVILETKFIYEEEGQYVEDYLRLKVTFTSVPEVMRFGRGQTGGTSRESPQPKKVIEPGGYLPVFWTVEGNVLGSWQPFRRPGIHLIRAHLDVPLADDTQVRLWSNEQPIVIGGVQRAAAASTATVIHSDEAAKMVSLNVGTLDGVKVGELFRVSRPMQGYWTLKVKEVSDYTSRAEVSSHFRGINIIDPDRWPGDVPERGEKAAFWEPAEADGAAGE